MTTLRPLGVLLPLTSQASGPRRSALAGDVVLDPTADPSNLATESASAVLSAGRSCKHPYSQADTDTRSKGQDVTQSMILSPKLFSDFVDLLLGAFAHGFCSPTRPFQKIQTRLE